MKTKRTRRDKKGLKAMAELDAIRDDMIRRMNTHVSSWIVCPDKTCARERACRGEVRACFERWWPHVPEEDKIRVRAFIKARVRGLSDEEAMAEAQAAVGQARELERRLAEPRGPQGPAAARGANGADGMISGRSRPVARVRRL